MSVTVREHEDGCPRRQFWDAGDFEARCSCRLAQPHAAPSEPVTWVGPAWIYVSAPAGPLVNTLANGDGGSGGVLVKVMGLGCTRCRLGSVYPYPDTAKEVDEFREKHRHCKERTRTP